MCGEEFFYNADVCTNAVGLITNCTGYSHATAAVPGSAGMFGRELFYNYSGKEEKPDHDFYLAGRGDLCLVCEENPVYALPLSRPTQCSLCEDDGMCISLVRRMPLLHVP